IYKIARKYYTTIWAIVTANPGISPANLQPGTEITVPYGTRVVYTDLDYTYDILELNLRGLKARYPALETGSAGRSVLGRNLYYIRLGNGPVRVSYNGAHHSLEWITAPLLMNFIEKFLISYYSGKNLRKISEGNAIEENTTEGNRGYDPQEIWDKSSIFIIPMVNPDGVDIVLNGPKPSNPYYQQLLAWNTTGLPFGEVWNSNTRGTDLNRNYPASWQEAKDQELYLGVYGPGPTRYGGPYPLSEPETRAVKAFTEQNNFRLVIAWHTQGEVIYWKYLDLLPPDILKIAESFSRASGYAVSNTPYEAAYAGYKDWFIKEYFRPGYTVEAGSGKNPLPISQFDAIYNDVEEIMLLAPLLV
ncbi:MAG: M14 family metallopeptidase, partial [Clostridiales bacterium]|nr:M14 family metallopeptidase [Clostridiales bacterium]